MGKQSSFGWSAKEKQKNVRKVVELYNEGFSTEMIARKLDFDIQVVITIVKLYLADELSAYGIRS